MAITGGVIGAGVRENLLKGEGFHILDGKFEELQSFPFSDIVFVGLPWLGLVHEKENCSLLQMPRNCVKQTWYRILALLWCDFGQVFNLSDPQCCHL